MRRVAGVLVLAVVFFAAAALSFAEARLSRLMADAHRRLATLRYDRADEVGEDAAPIRQLAWASVASEAERHRTTVRYWRAEYDELTPLTTAMRTSVHDSSVLLAGANALYRASHTESADRKTVIDRLDTVMQAYAEVMRSDPAAVDAAYNYEYVVRLRDALAKAKGPIRREPKSDASEASVDLPAGPTVHGRPGGPPADMPMNDFKTITPMRFDEREEQAQPGRGGVQRRRG